MRRRGATAQAYPVNRLVRRKGEPEERDPVRIAWLSMPFTRQTASATHGAKMDPTMAIGRRASGGAVPPFASICFKNMRENHGVEASPIIMPSRRPRNVNPVCHRLK